MMNAMPFIEDARATNHSPSPERAFWASHAGYGMLLGVSISVLEFAYYYPLVSAPNKLGVLSLASAFLNWCGEGVLLVLTVALFERWKAPMPLGARHLILAVISGSVAGVLAWQAFTQFVLHEQFGVWLFRDHLGQPENWAGTVLYHVWLMFVFGGLATAVYSSRQRHARTLDILRAAELSREALQRGLADARLAALQARIDPEFLFQTLTKLERLYEADPPGADRLLDELIVFLREALADIRASGASVASGQTPAREEAFRAV